MRSSSSSSFSSSAAINLSGYCIGFERPRTRSSLSLISPWPPTPISFPSSLGCCPLFIPYFHLKLGSNVREYGCRSRQRLLQVTAMDAEDSVGFSSFEDWAGKGGAVEYVLSASEDEDSDGEGVLTPITDLDLPTKREQFCPTNDALTLTAHRLAMLGRARKKRRIKYGVLNNIGLITFLTVLLLFVDWCAWRIVRLPLAPFYLMRPFSISAVLVACAGYICVPLLRRLKMQSIIRKRPARHTSKKGTPTMGGLFFIPIGIIVAEVIVGFSSSEVSGAAAATLAFAAIGILDDFLSHVKKHNNGLSSWMRIFLEVAVATWFSFWLYTTDISSPYSMFLIQQMLGFCISSMMSVSLVQAVRKMVVPLPAPLGLVCLGKFYILLVSFCFVSMANGTNLTDGLDGLAGGTAALAFIGMSIAVLPICSDLSIFGASMAGACVGFLLHNRYKASVLMGNTGSFALGGALAAMAACTGMFFPLFISTGVCVLQTLSIAMQVFFFKTTKYLGGTSRHLFQMAPFHHHLEICGFKEPFIVAGAYLISCVLVLCAGYAGLISA